MSRTKHQREIDEALETLVMMATAEDMCSKIEPILHNKDPGAQGACLAQLTAKWFAGHHPDIRGEVIDEHFKCVLALIPIFEKVILERYGGKWPEQQ